MSGLCATAAGSGSENPLLGSDPHRVVGPKSCTECHAAAGEAWERTAHFATFYRLQDDPSAQEIAAQLGVPDIKSSPRCLTCHYTPSPAGSGVARGGPMRAVAGVSCESCHGPARDWVELHSNFGSAPGGEKFTAATEPAAHRDERHARSSAGGMVSPRDLWAITAACYRCHVVPDQELVNAGGHTAASRGFELVSWFNGEVRHNFGPASDGPSNRPTSPHRQRLFFVLGMVQDLRFSLAALARAEGDPGRWGRTLARRATRVLQNLQNVQRLAPTPELAEVLAAAGPLDLGGEKLPPPGELRAAVEKIVAAGSRLAKGTESAGRLAPLDRYLPAPGKFVGRPHRGGG